MSDKLKIVADSAIPFLKGVFEPYAEVFYIPGGKITSSDLAEADALIIRTRTVCDEKLLAGTKVKIIATATIGTDHVDTGYCDRAGILVSNAPGCNAGGVMQYVLSALYGTASRKSVSLEGKTVGIIGVGNVGRRIEQAARYLGLKVIKNDPPRQKMEGAYEFSSLDTLLASSDIVTIHTPLDSVTEGMADRRFFKKMKKGAFFINAARGGLVVEEDLIDMRQKLGPVIIDTWAGEPHINRNLMDVADIATPHIAGYSYQGKQNGTAAAVRAVARFFGITELYEFFPVTDIPEHEAVALNLRGKTQGEITAIFQYNYPIFTDDFMFRLNPGDFEHLREEYQYRREVYFA